MSTFVEDLEEAAENWHAVARELWHHLQGYIIAKYIDRDLKALGSGLLCKPDGEGVSLVFSADYSDYRITLWDQSVVVGRAVTHEMFRDGWFIRFVDNNDQTNTLRNTLNGVLDTRTPTSTQEIEELMWADIII